jgi:hypothetical protein
MFEADEVEASEMRLFYQRLLLLSRLTGAGARQSAPASQHWHRFLDDLCSLCDSCPGGRTVVSIAVQSTSTGMLFWIAANASLLKASEQLARILDICHQLHVSGSGNVLKAQSEIISITASFSRRKIRNYERWLRRQCNMAGESSHFDDTEGGLSYTHVSPIALTLQSSSCACTRTYLDRSRKHLRRDVSKNLRLQNNVTLPDFEKNVTEQD